VRAEDSEDAVGAHGIGRGAAENEEGPVHARGRDPTAKKQRCEAARAGSRTASRSSPATRSSTLRASSARTKCLEVCALTIAVSMSTSGPLRWAAASLCVRRGTPTTTSCRCGSTRLSSLGLHEASRLLFGYDLGETTIVTLTLEQTGDATAPPQSLPRVLNNSLPPAPVAAAAAGSARQTRWERSKSGMGVAQWGFGGA
jgi:hypothetical protein